MERRRTEDGWVKFKGLILVCLLLSSLVSSLVLIRPVSAKPAVSSSKFVEYIKELEPIPHPAPVEKLDVKTALIPHAPIYIDGDSGFTPANGVNGGSSGTSDDPYIIENWAISASGTTGITIQNTTKYFIIRNCLIENGGAGIYLGTVINGLIENNICYNNKYGISLYDSSCVNLTNNICVTKNDYYGIFLFSSSHDNLTGNTCGVSEYGILLAESSTYNNLVGNTCENNACGIYLDGSFGDNLTNNTCKNNDCGIYISSPPGSSNILTGNVISNNVRDILNTGTANTYFSNQFDTNAVNKMLTLSENTRTKNVGDNVSFSVSAFDLNGVGLSGCTTITISPSESSLSYSDNGSGGVTGSFTPTKSGTYSLNVTVTDENSNTTKRKIFFFVGNTASTTTKYYFRGLSPTHGQPYGNGNDCKTLLLTAPTNTEIWYCGRWAQNTPDEIPNYPLANLSKIDTCTWYKQTSAITGYIGVQRYATQDVEVDNSNHVDSVTDYTWINENFTGLNWAMDYLRSWYWLNLKLNGTDPYWTTFPAGHSASEASYALFTYSYTTTPIIKSISNSDMAVLSATEPVGDDNATIVIDGTGSTNIVLDNYKRPFIGYTTTINSDNTATIAANNLTGTTTINSVAMDITPSSGYIDVGIDNWNTSGAYYKKWTETGSSPSITASHTIGNLKANTYYTVKVDGTIFNTYQSNSSGQITFVYNEGYSTKTFEIEELPGQPTLYLPADGTLTNDNTPYFEWTCGSNADSHRLLVDNDPDFSSPEENQLLGATDNTYTVPDDEALAPGRYYWRVRAVDGAGNVGEWSDVWQFTIDTTPPPTPTLVSPPHGSSTKDSTPTFEWTSVYDPSGVTYTLQYTRTNTFLTATTVEGLAGNTYTVPDNNALTLGFYNWRVRAVDGAGNASNWSKSWWFRVKVIPVPPGPVPTIP